MIRATTPGARASLGTSVLAAWLVCVAATPGAAQVPAGDALLERTLAVVGGQAITASDVVLATRLGLIEAQSGPSPTPPITRLIERLLMLHEVARFAPPEPDSAVVAARGTEIRQRAGTPGELQAILDRAGVTLDHVDAWVRDDLRIAAYLDQRFASAGAPTVPEVDGYYQEHLDEFFRAGVSQEEAVRQSRERLTQERRRALIADWLADVRRRTDVLVFPGE